MSQPFNPMKKLYLSVMAFLCLFLSAFAQNPTLVYPTNGAQVYPNGRYAGKVTVGMDTNLMLFQGNTNIYFKTGLSGAMWSLTTGGTFTVKTIISDYITNHFDIVTYTNINALIANIGTLNVTNQNWAATVNAGGNTITNLAAGTTPDSAVTVGQMNATNSGFVTLGTAQTITGVKTFDNALPIFTNASTFMQWHGPGQNPASVYEPFVKLFITNSGTFLGALGSYNGRGIALFGDDTAVPGSAFVVSHGGIELYANAAQEILMVGW